MDIIFTICSINDEFSYHLEKEFEKDNKYNIIPYHGDFRELDDYDCIVSPGNSHGIMDGGIDMAISKHFGYYLDFIKQVQSYLKKNLISNKCQALLQ